jgi:outer membrane lipoprotein-sorting protein
MKVILSLLSVLLASGQVFSQSQNAARALLDKAYSTFEASGGVAFSFKSVITGQQGDFVARQSGEACIKGDKFKFVTEDMDIWFDGKTQWILMKEVNEVNVSAPTASEIEAISPLALLSGYRNGFTLKAPASKTIHGRSALLVDMIPVNQNPDFTSITAAIDKESGNIVQITLFMTDGTKNVIDISGYNTNHRFDDALFGFDKNAYPGVEVIDLR